MYPNRDHSNFHTDQGRWDRRDYANGERFFEDDSEEDLDLSPEEASRPDHLSRVYRDEEIEQVVKELLRNSKNMDASDVTVTVNDSMVKLSGTMKSQKERDYAIGVVKLVHGVGDVKSEIIVKTHGGILPNDLGRD
ncbi:BON domain-containing protein [Peredibacter sp. HCB2-198]|uniref:BON domain-containing protein n=1 Tax=Peredibacter sp. HCB2-198 TaxID=3383025 RepID=UPI0038B47710